MRGDDLDEVDFVFECLEALFGVHRHTQEHISISPNIANASPLHGHGHDLFLGQGLDRICIPRKALSCYTLESLNFLCLYMPSITSEKPPFEKLPIAVVSEELIQYAAKFPEIVLELIGALAIEKCQDKTELLAAIRLMHKWVNIAEQAVGEPSLLSQIANFFKKP